MICVFVLVDSVGVFVSCMVLFRLLYFDDINDSGRRKYMFTIVQLAVSIVSDV